MSRRNGLIAVAVLMLATVWPGVAASQDSVEYTIGPGDVLSVAVWRHPELERQVTVRTNGLATFPPVGDVRAAGLTPSGFSRQLTERLRDYMGETTQVTVTVQQFNSRAVFLSGQVAAPGRYSFEQMPDVLQLISQAGGPLPSADLSSVAIVRAGPSGPVVLPVDLAAYMRGELASLPVLQAGDTVEVPSVMGIGGMGGGGLVYVLGEVAAPGAFPTTDRLDLFQAIALAGGTTPEARLDEVAVVMDSGDGQSVAMLDLERISRNGTANPFFLEAGDRVIVPKAGEGIGSQIWNATEFVLGSATEILSAYLLLLTIDREIDDRDLREAEREALEAQ